MDSLKKIGMWVLAKIRNNLWKSGLLFLLIGAAYIANIDKNKENKNCTFYKVTAEKLNIRDAPGLNSNIVGNVEKSSLLCIDLIDNDWVHIKNSNWVNSKYLVQEDRNFIDDYIEPVIFKPLLIFFLLIFSPRIFNFLFGSSKKSSNRKAKLKEKEATSKPIKETQTNANEEPQITHALESGSAIHVFSGTRILFTIGASKLINHTNSTVTYRSRTKGSRSGQVKNAKGQVIKTFTLQDPFLG